MLNNLTLVSIKRLFFALTVCASHALQAQAQTKDYEAEYAKGYRGGYIKKLESIDGALEFAVVGGFGRGGEYFQKDMAKQLAKAVTGTNASFIISTGDNIYPHGVASVRDPLWQLSYEHVFYQYPLHRDWYAVLGNHDYAGNAQAQIDYTHVSQRWNMPARYYTFKRSVGKDAYPPFHFRRRVRGERKIKAKGPTRFLCAHTRLHDLCCYGEHAPDAGY